MVELVPDPPMPVVPEMDDYHAAGHSAATDVPAECREHVIAFLDTMTHRAGVLGQSLMAGHTGR